MCYINKMKYRIEKAIRNTALKWENTLCRNTHRFWVKLGEQLAVPVCKCPDITETITERKRIYNWA